MYIGTATPLSMADHMSLNAGRDRPICGHVCWMRARWRDPKRPRRATPGWKRPSLPAGGEVYYNDKDANAFVPWHGHLGHESQGRPGPRTAASTDERMNG